MYTHTYIHVVYVLLLCDPLSFPFVLMQTWNEQVNVQKAILPGLWAVLDSGGYGCAKVIYPCFLPLLSQLVNKVRLITSVGVYVCVVCVQVMAAMVGKCTCERERERERGREGGGRG